MDTYKNSFMDGNTKFDVVIIFDGSKLDRSIDISVTATNKFYFKGKKNTPEEITNCILNYELLRNMKGKDSKGEDFCEWIKGLTKKGAFLPEKHREAHEIMTSENRTAKLKNTYHRKVEG